MRRATRADYSQCTPPIYFYPRSPCGERPRPCPSRGRNRNFYPRSPCGERRIAAAIVTAAPTFLSTLSLRRATAGMTKTKGATNISIHALLAESDHDTYVIMEAKKVISIHALLAESDAYGRINDISRLIFLSTLSLRRATLHYRLYHRCMHRFLSTLSLRRATILSILIIGFLEFLSTLSLRRATLRVLDGSKSSIISIHALLAESDSKNAAIGKPTLISIHALLAESDQCRTFANGM